MFSSTFLAPATLPKRRTQLFLLTTFLCLPALWAGYMGDDFIHHALLSANIPIDKPNDLSLFGLFSFINGDPERNRLLMDYSLLPWWTYSELKYAFWRPVSELFHWLDHRFWPNHAWLMHLHNIVWYLGILLVVNRLYQRSLIPAASVVALAIYALDSSHGFTLSWIANRNGLICVLFGLLSLKLYMDWREQENTLGALGSLMCLILGLLSAEMGISIFGYFIAYALFLDKRGPVKGLLATLPYFLVIVLWWAFYKVSGFGAANADSYYVDPAEHPMVFATKLMERFPVLMAGQWGIVPAEIYGFSGITNWGYVAVCALFLLLCFIPIVLIGWKKPSIRFWFTGMLFSVLPALTALPHDRLLMFTGVGAAAIMGDFLASLFVQKYRPAGKLLKKTVVGVAGLLFLFHLVISPLLLPLISYSTKIWADFIPTGPTYFSDIDDIKTKQLVIFGPPIASALAIGPMRFHRQDPMPERLWTITSQPDPLTFERISPTTLKVSNPLGFMREQTEKAFRDTQKHPLQEGEQTQLSGLTISIHDLNADGIPTTLTLKFDHELSDDKLVFLQWSEPENRYSQISF